MKKIETRRHKRNVFKSHNWHILKALFVFCFHEKKLLFLKWVWVSPGSREEGVGTRVPESD